MIVSIILGLITLSLFLLSKKLKKRITVVSIEDKKYLKLAQRAKEICKEDPKLSLEAYEEVLFIHECMMSIRKSEESFTINTGLVVKETLIFKQDKGMFYIPQV